MASREAFLARVRQAAEQGRLHRVHLKPVPENIGYLGASGDLCERFASEVNAVGGQAFVVPDLDAARHQLQLLLNEAGARSVLSWKHPVLVRLQLSKLLATAGVNSYDYERLRAMAFDEQRQTLLAGDVGITSCDAAIAETGSLMMCSRPGQERLASLLPPMHIAIVERQQIVPDLIDALALLMTSNQMTNDQAPSIKQIQNPESKIQNLPSNVTFITGPSKTGDIELQLTTGVHGPGKWRVIIVQ
jgi:L-lactate dehydrogenase complex protein LldG